MIKRRIVLMMAMTLSLILPALPRTRAQQGKGVGIRPKADLVEWPSRSKRWALIIGVDRYESQRITPLIGAVNDAHRLAEALIEYAGFPRDQVIVLATDQTASELKPTRNNILERLANLNGVVPQDGLFFFAFSGHGVEANNRGFLLPSDAVTAEKNERLLERTAVSISDVQDEIFAAGIRQVVALLDACRNDPRPGKGGGENLMSNSFNFELRNQSVEGVITFYATSPGLRAYEDTVKKQGYFSYTFIEGLKGAAANPNGEVTLERLANYLKERVPFYVKRDLGAQRQQVPRIVVENYGAEKLVLAVTGKRATAISADAEIAYWNSIKDSGSPANFRAYLGDFPNGQFRRLAENILRELEEARNRPPEVNPAPSRPNALAPVIPLPRGVHPSRLAVHTFTTATVDAKGAVSKFAGTPTQQYSEDLGNGVRLEMVAVKGSGRIQDFWIGKFEVTQAQWKAAMGSNPSQFKGDKLPVENVSWEDASEFCRRLNVKLGLSEAEGYRLMKEAEWEYAARAGTKTEFAFGDTFSFEVMTSSADGSVGRKEEPRKTVEVGSLGVANAWGIFDMHGNVWEWCDDVFEPGTGTTLCVMRGGSWSSEAHYGRSAGHYGSPPNSRGDNLGFRISRTAPEK